MCNVHSLIMGFQEGICILCLKKCDNFKTIVGNTKHTLDFLLLKIKFTRIQEPVMCKNCEEMLIKCCDFKTTCLYTRDCINPFVNKKDGVKLDLKYVYLNKNVIGIAVTEDEDVCGFCMALVKKCFTLSVDVEEGDVLLKKMIEECLPELDLSIVKKPVICTPCHESLDNCFRFVSNCLIVEEKIKEYCETLDMSNKSQIQLSDVLQFTKRNLTKSEVDGKSVDTIKAEQQFCDYRDNPDEIKIGKGGEVIKLEQMLFDNSEDAYGNVKIKTECFMHMDDQKVNGEHQVTPKNILVCEEESNNFGPIKIEQVFCENNEIEHIEDNYVETIDQKYLLDEELEIKTDERDLSRFESVFLPHPEVTASEVPMYKCDYCPFQTEIKYYLKKHLLKHEDASQVTMYRCYSCAFQSKRKEVLTRHLLKHKEPSEVPMYKCETCQFQTKFKFYLEKHSLVHKDPSEVTLHKCDSCLFQTIHPNSLKVHLLMHKDPSELTMHKCEICSFETKFKFYLKKHLVMHKDPSQVKMFNCDSCPFQSKRKEVLKRHSLKHKIHSEVPVYKCETCPFQTKFKFYLKKHLLRHDPSQVTMFKCDSCLYQTNHKSNLKTHLLLHKDPSELTMYNCDLCAFQTKRKDHLKTHSLLHKDPSEVTMYKCDLCSFETKSTKYLKSHLLVHKDPSEVTMHKCDSCSFETRHKSNLKTHLLLHRDPLKVTMYKCDSCSFQTKRKNNLKTHSLNHKEPSEITMYKCESCRFRTKSKYYLKRHELTHNQE